MDDQEYVAALLDILTNPTPTGIDPADPYARADDGIDRSDGFGRDVKVTGAQVVGDPHGDKLEVTFILTLPAGDPDWAGVPEDGAVRVPFDAQWRHLSQFTDPAAYAPVVASRVMWAARDHAVDHQHGGRRAKARAERRTRTRAGLPDRDTQRQLLLDALETEWKVTQVAPDRFELRLRQDPTDNSSDDRAQGSGDELALDAAPEVITFLLSPEEWEEVLVDHHEDVNLYFAETLAAPDPDERFVVFYNGELHCSTRPQLPPVRGRAEERAWARLRENHPLGPDDGWYAFDPHDPEDRDARRRRPPPL